MNDKQHSLNDERARILKALGHPSRVFIIDTLQERPKTVGELTELIGSDASTVSKHLSILKSVGIVTDRKQGNLVFYSLRCAECISQFFGGVEAVMKANLERQVAFTQPD